MTLMMVPRNKKTGFAGDEVGLPCGGKRINQPQPSLSGSVGVVVRKSMI
jgi:hypothetical protein